MRPWFNGFMDKTNKRRTVSLNAAYASNLLATVQPDLPCLPLT